jgi:hypothetical protein
MLTHFAPFDTSPREPGPHSIRWGEDDFDHQKCMQTKDGQTMNQNPLNTWWRARNEITGLPMKRDDSRYECIIAAKKITIMEAGLW